MNKTKWIYYTVSVGLLPLVLRLLTALLAQDLNEFRIFNPADIVFFGLVLGISNINEIELLKDIADQKKFVTRTNGVSIIFIVLFTFLLAITLVNEIYLRTFNSSTILIVSFILTTVFFIFTLSVYNNLTRA